MAKDRKVIDVSMEVSEQLLAYVLCSCVEGGYSPWFSFTDAERTHDLLYKRVKVTDIYREKGDRHESVRERSVEPRDLALGLERLAAIAAGKPSPNFDRRAAGRHLGDILSQSGDAITADVLLQLTVFNAVIYG